MENGKFKDLIIDSYNKAKEGNLMGLIYGAVSTYGFHDILDIKEFAKNANPDMLYLKSKLTDTEANIYEWQLGNILAAIFICKYQLSFETVADL